MPQRLNGSSALPVTKVTSALDLYQAMVLIRRRVTSESAR